MTLRVRTALHVAGYLLFLLLALWPGPLWFAVVAVILGFTQSRKPGVRVLMAAGVLITLITWAWLHPLPAMW